jgi:PRTRC genetic system protein A
MTALLPAAPLTPVTAQPLVGYTFLRGEVNPPIEAALYEYLLASNGLFVRGAREGLRALIPVAQCLVRGLGVAEPYCELLYPPVPDVAVEVMLDEARRATGRDGQPVEILYHLSWEGGTWRLSIPEQEATETSVQPVHTGPGSSYERAIIEVHSHHAMRAFWSGTDDRDEQGFRLYGVIGDIFERPTLRLRVGIYGYFWEIPASQVFALPEEVRGLSYEGGEGEEEAPKC